MSYKIVPSKEQAIEKMIQAIDSKCSRCGNGHIGYSFERKRFECPKCGFSWVK